VFWAAFAVCACTCPAKANKLVVSISFKIVLFIVPLSREDRQKLTVSKHAQTRDWCQYQ
jgi:hypothetical protein